MYIDSPEARQELIRTLKERVVKVTFTKADGTERTITCTLLQTILDQYFSRPAKPESNKPRKVTEVCKAFEVNEETWKSFRYDSIKHYTFYI